jgi:hypothetical protein
MLLTVAKCPFRLSAAISTSSSSLPEVVENAGEVTVELAVAWSFHTCASTVGADEVTAGGSAKLTPVTLAPLMVTFWLAGENVNPVLLGVRV